MFAALTIVSFPPSLCARLSLDMRQGGPGKSIIGSVGLLPAHRWIGPLNRNKGQFGSHKTDGRSSQTWEKTWRVRSR
jgi:hypothetical protein